MGHVLANKTSTLLNEQDSVPDTMELYSENTAMYKLTTKN
jgi:hypothetical protein